MYNVEQSTGHMKLTLECRGNYDKTTVSIYGWLYVLHKQKVKLSSLILLQNTAGLLQFHEHLLKSRGVIH
jgi:hypothetical protein